MYGVHIVGKDNASWKGDKVGYSALHSWVRRCKGKAKICEKCNKENGPAKDGRFKLVQWVNISREYKRDLEDFMALCVPCHKKYDLESINLDRGD